MGSLGNEKLHAGYTDWSPQSKTRYWLQCVNEILQQYQEYLPLTIRQIFYRLVASYEYDKTEQAYSRLINYLGRARRARMIPFGSVRDDGAMARGPHSYANVDAYLEMVREEAETFTLQRQDNQPGRVEVWCEAGGMVPLLADAIAEYGVNVYSGGGFNSLTTVRNTAGRIANDERKTIAISFGDYDPSGESIFDSFRQDVERFVAQLTGTWDRVEFKRVALTEEQVDDMGIPTAPPKSTDSRSANWIGDTAQLEAIPPDELAQLAVDSVLPHIDMKVLKADKRREERIRDKLEPLVETMYQSVAGYEGDK